MRSIGKLAGGQEQCYPSRVASGVEDYHLGSGDAAGQWLGDGAARLALTGCADARSGCARSSMGGIQRSRRR